MLSDVRTLLDLGSTCCAKVVVSSREDSSYLMKANNVTNFKIQVSQSSITGDITTYIKDEIRLLRNRGDLALGDPSLEVEIERFD